VAAGSAFASGTLASAGRHRATAPWYLLCGAEFSAWLSFRSPPLGGVRYNKIAGCGMREERPCLVIEESRDRDAPRESIIGVLSSAGTTARKRPSQKSRGSGAKHLPPTAIRLLTLALAVGIAPQDWAHIEQILTLFR
jgi:hypothetical protein